VTVRPFGETQEKWNPSGLRLNSAKSRRSWYALRCLDRLSWSLLNGSTAICQYLAMQ
jgi:hypothetical protein